VAVIRVGLVGAGPWARLFHAPMLAAAAGLELSAVWARRRDAAAEVARQFGTAAVATFEELLERCDAVAFAVPPDAQAALAPRAAERGRHLLLEKPVASTVAEAAVIAAAAEAAGVVTQLVLTYRFTEPVRAFLRSVAGTPVRHVSASWIGGGALDGSPFATPWRQAPGAALLDLGPHAFDLVEAVAGPVEAVHASESGGVLAATTYHDGGVVGHVALSVTTPGDGGFEALVVTDEGRLALADPAPERPDDLWRAITDEFARAVRGEAEQPLDVRHGLHLQRVLAAARSSVGSGSSVRVGDAH
jgi:predicted dehydrogenase